MTFFLVCLLGTVESVEDEEKSNLFYDVSLKVFVKSESDFLAVKEVVQ